nr:phage tail protein [Brucella anthropi]
MPFLAPIFTAIGGIVSSVAAWAAASPILAGIAQTAFGIAIKYGLNALFPPKTQSRAAELEVQYGANIPRSVILGTCAVEGHHVYRNTYGSGGRLVQDVFVLASFRITSVPRVRYNGKWRDLNQQDGDGYWLVPNEGTSNDDHDNVRVKIYYGTMDQQAEPTLINNARPAGRWTANHRGAGVAYAIVFSELRKNGDGLTSPAKLLFEVVGAPLYDWRKDSTMGGAGSHRWNDQNTWEYSDNPAVQVYNLGRGFFNGTQRMVGKAVRAALLPLAEYTQAANICDEFMTDGSKRYRAHAIAKDGPGANHDANLTPILEAMCGAWVERVDSEFPIAGAPQAIIATITDEDIRRGAPLRYTAKRKRTELINTVASSYVSPEDFYETKTAATRIDAGALAEDRETLASAIPYGAVTDPRQVDRLADIAIRGARYQASADIVVHPKFLDTIKEGRWIRWNSAKYGDRTYQVLTRQLGGLNTDGVRNISVSLQQISNGVFDPTAYETDPPDIIVIPPPEYLAEVQHFDVLPIIVKADGAGELPGARLIWDPISDITVIGVTIEYWPANDPTQIFTKFVTWDVVNVPIVEGLTSLTDWFVRTKLRVDNGRSVAWSAAKPFRTLNAQGDQNPIDYEHLDSDLKGYLGWIGPQVRELIRFCQELVTQIADNHANAYEDRQMLVRRLESTFGSAQAQWEEAIFVATGPNSAIAQQLTTINAQLFDDTGASIIQVLQARVDGVEDDVEAQANLITQLSSNIGEVSANATFRMGSYNAPSGWNARIGMEVRGGTADNFKSAGMFLDVTSTQARIAFIAEQIVFSNGTDFFKPFVIQNNVMYGEGFVMDWAKIVNVTIQWAQIQNAVINNAVFGTTNIDFGAVTEASSAPFNQQVITSAPPVAALVVTNPVGNKIIAGANLSLTFGTGAGGGTITLKLSIVNNTTGKEVISNTGTVKDGTATLTLSGSNVDFTSIAGNNVYAVKLEVLNSSGTTSVNNVIGTVQALVWKR